MELSSLYQGPLWYSLKHLRDIGWLVLPTLLEDSSVHLVLSRLGRGHCPLGAFGRD